jgi:hypothetical protein
LNNSNAFGGTFAKPHKPLLKASFAKEPPSQRTKDTVKNGQQSNDRQNAST